MSKRRVRPFKPYYYPSTHRGTPLPPPLGLYGSRRKVAGPAEMPRKSNNPNFIPALLAQLIIQGIELLVWASVLWVVGDQLDEAGIINSNIQFFDLFWISGLVIFAIRFSKAINRASSLTGEPGGPQ